MILYIILSFIFSILPAEAENACRHVTTLGETGTQLNRMEEINAFLLTQEKQTKGNDEKCSSALGRYTLKKDGNDITARFSPIHKAYLPFSANRYNSLLKYEKIEKNGKSEFAGLLIKAKEEWYLTELKPGVRFPYPSISQETATIQAFEDFYLRKKEAPGVNIHKIDFGNDMLVGNSEQIKLEYDSNASIDEFLSQHEDPINFIRRLDNHTTRIPPKMYDLLKDKEFIRARELREYSRMYDKIFAKAMEIAEKHIAKALFISLITIDLRDRGSCGAVYGARGFTIVPPSIFDKEIVEASLIGSRYDAAQHFFGLALLTNKYGENALSMYSSLYEAELLKSFGRIFRELHGEEPDFGRSFDDKILPLVSIWYKGRDLRFRQNFDKKADLHYNRLGIEFAKRLKENSTTSPSSIINDPIFNEFKSKIGLPINPSTNWIFEPDEAMISVRDYENSKREITYRIYSPKYFKFLNSKNWGGNTKVFLFNGNNPIDKCNTTLSGSYYALRISFDSTKECTTFLKSNNKRYIFSHEGRKYFMNHPPQK